MIVLFDGVCNLCNRLVGFIIKRDSKNIFEFAPIQSEKGQQLINKFGKEPGKLYSILFIEKEICYQKSTAVLKILKYLKGLWKLLYVFIIIPPFIRDILYNFIAKNRYLWFGKNEKCMVPDDRIIQKFVN